MHKSVKQLKERLKAEGKSGLALDIDEVLSWTLKWWVTEMQKLFGNPENLSVEDLIKKYRYVQNVPYWEGEEIAKWVMAQIDSDELQIKLPLIKDADRSVREIHDERPFVAYITNRPEHVRKGTETWLDKHKFPKVPLITRPIDVDPYKGTIWKGDVLHYLYPEVSGIIDDNPSLVDHLPKGYKGTVYLYDSVEHSRKDINVIPCRDWKEVKELLGIKENNGGR